MTAEQQSGREREDGAGSPRPRRALREGATVIGPLAAFLLVNVLLLGPRWIAAGRVGPEWIALELLVIMGVFALLPARRWVVALAWGTALSLGTLSLLALADGATRLSLGRSLNLLLDFQLLRAVHHLLSGTVGSAGATLVMGAVAALSAVAIFGLARLLTPNVHEVGAGRAYVGGATLVAAGVLGVAALLSPTVGAWVAFPAAGIVVEQGERLSFTLRERERFAVELAEGPESYADWPDLLEDLRGTDVILAFMESYGISAIEDARYGKVLRPRLEDMETRLRAAGLHLATGTLVAPTQGGQSWLSHGSLLSGLWVENQIRYDLLVASGRESLVHDFSHAGHRTAVVMPAITMPWPEGRSFGYDEIFVYRNMEYAGPPLNWVTMPDQYTWSFLESTVRSADDGALFAVIGLISSHAPWTPVLPVLDDWESVGDGSVFSQWEDAGESPEELWRDMDRVREQYALSTEYAVHVMATYAERYATDRTFIIALGDHQPAPLITGDAASREVPVHVIAADSALLAPFIGLGFRPGAFPHSERDPFRMDAFRDWFVRAFSGPPDPAEAR